MDNIQILQDYKNKMFTKDIMLKHNISWNKLTKFLKENNVYQKNNSLMYSDEIIEKLKLWYGVISNKDLAKSLNISEDHLVTKIKELKIPLRGSGTVNKPILNYLDYNSDEFYYYLGWMASDGNISKTYRNVSLSITDEEIVNKFHKLFPEAKIYIQPKGKNKTMYL